jgi:hypothetical protein
MTYDPKNDWQKINWKAVKQFRLDIGRGKLDYWRKWYDLRTKHHCGYVDFPNWKWEADPMTTIYSLIAFLHGKQHMTKKRVPICDNSGGTTIVPFTPEMQAQLIGDLWQEFLLKEPAVVEPALTIAV